MFLDRSAEVMQQAAPHGAVEWNLPPCLSFGKEMIYYGKTDKRKKQIDK